jgi:hypothetical protein
LMECRDARHDTLAANYPTCIQLASIRSWLRIDAPRPWCPDSEVRIIVRHARLRTSESKGTSNLLT